MWPAPLTSLCRRRTHDTAAVVLAGGEARRFGRPKQRIYMDGVPVLRRITEAVRSCVDTVYVSAPNASAACGLAALAGDAGCMVDEECRCMGPPRAMLSSAAAGYPLVLLVPADMARLTSIEIAGFLHHACSGSTCPDAAVLLWGEGRMDFLLGLYSERVLAGLRGVCRVKAGVLRVRAGDAVRLSGVIRLVPSELVASDPLRLSHITVRGDEYSPRPRGRHGAAYRARDVRNEGATAYKRAVESLEEGDLSGAFDAFIEEHMAHMGAGLLHLAAQSLSDAARLAPLVGADSSELWRRVHGIYRLLEEAR